MIIKNQTRGTVLAKRVFIADTWWKRLRGLLGKDKLVTGEALILEPCNSVHTCFMKFPIDVLFIDKKGVVTEIYENLKPYRFTRVVRRARQTIELPAGTVQATTTLRGDRVELIPY